MTPRSRRTFLLAAGLGLVVWAVLIAAAARAKFGGDPRGLLFLGRSFPHPAALAGVPLDGKYGYDGQFYAAIAADPFLRSPETLRALDAPAYRATRILVPLLAWLVTLGDARAAVAAYQGLCWVLSILAFAVVARWLWEERASPWWAGLLSVNAGLVTAMFRSTVDGAAVCLVVGTLWAARRGAHGRGVAAAALGNLCREVSAVVPLALAVQGFLAGARRRALAYAVVPLLPALAWQAYIRAVWHPNVRLPASVGVPGIALAGKVAAVLGGHLSLLSQELWGTLAVLLTVLGGLVVLGRRGRLEPERLVFAAFALLAMLLAPRAYADVYGFTRQLIVAPFLALPVAAGERSRWVRALLLSGPVAFAASGLLMIAGELHPLFAG